MQDRRGCIGSGLRPYRFGGGERHRRYPSNVPNTQEFRSMDSAVPVLHEKYLLGLRMLLILGPVTGHVGDRPDRGR